MRKLLFLLILLSACAAPPRAMQATQALGTATNTPYSVGTEFVIPITPVQTSAPCFYIPLGTLTPTPQGYAMTEYITTSIAQIYNNNGAKMDVWQPGRVFVTGDWIENGRLYLGPNIPNRWIPVGTYKEVAVTPPPVDPPPPAFVGEIVNFRVGDMQTDGTIIWKESRYFQEIPPELLGLLK